MTTGYSWQIESRFGMRWVVVRFDGVERTAKLLKQRDSGRADDIAAEMIRRDEEITARIQREYEQAFRGGQS